MTTTSTRRRPVAELHSRIRRPYICLDVPDIQQAYRTLVERGATIRGRPRVAGDGYRAINVTDSNDLRVELMEPQPAKK